MTWALWTGACSAAVSAFDDRGKEVVLAAPAQRVVALAPSLTELVYAAGAGERLVGVASYSDYPAGAARLARVGDASRIDFERVLSLAPELILGWKSGNRVADIERLESLGFKVIVFEPGRLSDIERALRVLGALTASSVTANAAADAFAQQVAALRSHYQGERRLRVFYEIWHEPLMTVNGAHMISEVVELCGGTNLFSSAASLTPAVSLEALLGRQPEVIVGGRSGESADHFAALWSGYRQFAGLRDIATIYINPDVMQRQTPRILQGARELCEGLEKVRREAKR
jgi:iron complex transport system substrate-binding protein